MIEPNAELGLRLQVLVEIASGLGRTILEQAPSLSEGDLRKRIDFLLQILDGPLEALRAPASSASAWPERRLDPADLPF